MAAILVLDDNIDMLFALREVLEMCDHKVLCAQDGLEGLQVLAEEKSLPDLIITDLNMPMMGGVPFLKAIRENVCWRHIPVIILSGQPSDRPLVLGLGADAYLPKPFRFEDLYGALEHLISAAKAT